MSDRSKTRKSLVGVEVQSLYVIERCNKFCVPFSSRQSNEGDPLLGNVNSFFLSTCVFNLLSRRDVELEEGNSVNQDTAYFTVRGTSLGTASLTFTASTMGRGSATSEPKDIQVKSIGYRMTN